MAGYYLISFFVIKFKLWSLLSFYGGTYDEDFRDILLTKELRRGKIKSQATSDPYTLLEKAVAATDIARFVERRI